jgi:hypothetical protein
MRAFVLVVLSSVALCAQSFEAPQYYIGASASYDYYGHSGAAASTDVAIRLGQSNVYSYSSIDLPRQKSQLPTVRTGLGVILATRGNSAVVIFGNTGAAFTSGNLLGSVGAGAFVAYDLGSRLSKGVNHFYFTVGERILDITSKSITPAFEVGVGIGF